MDVDVRPTTALDRDTVLALVRAAFATGGREGNDEVHVVTATWACPEHTPAWDLVAVVADTVVGHVLCCHAAAGSGPVPAVAPLAVAPAYQRRGVGTALMTALLRQLDHDGVAATVLLGEPAYYSRFAFGPAAAVGLWYPPVGRGNPHFQVRRGPSGELPPHGAVRYCWEAPATMQR